MMFGPGCCWCGEPPPPPATCCETQPETLQLDLSGLGLIWNFQSLGGGPCTQIDVSNLNTVYALADVGDNVYGGGTDFSGGDPSIGTPIVSITVQCYDEPGFPIYWTIELTIELWGIGGFDPQVFNAYAYSNFCDPIIIDFTGFTQTTAPSTFACIAMTLADPDWQDLYAGWMADVYE